MKDKIIKYITMVVPILGGIHLKHLELQGRNLMIMGNFLTLIIIVVLALASFIMILININVKENNRINVLAYGYFILGIITTGNIYLYMMYIHQGCLPVIYYGYMTLTQILELILLYVVVHMVNEQQNIKSWLIGIALFTVFIWGSCLRKSNVIAYLVVTQYKASYVLLAIGFIVMSVKLHYCNLYESETIYFKWSMLAKVIYLLGNLNDKIFFNGMWTFVFYTINTLHCILMYEFIYRVIVKQVWWPADKKLDMTESELEQEELERYNLVFASYALKSYVGSIDNSTQILKKKMKKGCNARSLEHLEKIKNNCSRLMKLSNNILDLGQMDIGNITPKYKVTNMKELISVLVESILPYVESRGLKVEVIQTNLPVFCCVDSDEIERVLLNLISNAIKYSDQNGVIRVYLNIKGERAYICVEDTGVGIPEDKLRNIFERFERVDTGFSRMQEGSGLGLAIVKSIIEMHQGEIKIQSKEGKGTLVSFNLPIHNGQKNKQIETRSKAVLKRKIEVEFADLKR